MKDLERLTGIKAHTLRIWEQRYGVINPKRTESNIRYFNEEDLKYILNIAMLNNNGVKISKIASMNLEEIRKQVLEVSEDVDADSDLLNALTLTMLELNEERFEKIMGNVVIKLGFEHAITKVIYPFMHRIGILWQTGSIVPAQEHFISNLVKHKLIVASDNMLAKKNDNPKKFVLFLPEGEMHEIGLLFANYMIKTRGHKSVYLGQTVPMEDLAVINDVYDPDYLFTVLTYQTGLEEVNPYIQSLSEMFDKSEVLLSGMRIEHTDLKDDKWKNVNFIRDLNDLTKLLDELED